MKMAKMLHNKNLFSLGIWLFRKMLESRLGGSLFGTVRKIIYTFHSFLSVRILAD
ncbi:hypothetical protein DB44_CE00110 [Candidatus Protochlamydia amoebophila]|uniref:Uncharacterized protein n=1 Tax=Candidatus Protochlamydia amoebophila TaxID=362787 RepID=A0A0C1JZI6_9BACT|nr:hypothetical protein DB44_CE00110 [Candidatus Protochlamydia amoebophila]